MPWSSDAQTFILSGNVPDDPIPKLIGKRSRVGGNGGRLRIASCFDIALLKDHDDSQSQSGGRHSCSNSSSDRESSSSSCFELQKPSDRVICQRSNFSVNKRRRCSEFLPLVTRNLSCACEGFRNRSGESRVQLFSYKDDPFIEDYDRIFGKKRCYSIVCTQRCTEHGFIGCKPRENWEKYGNGEHRDTIFDNILIDLKSICEELELCDINGSNVNTDSTNDEHNIDRWFTENNLNNATRLTTLIQCPEIAILKSLHNSQTGVVKLVHSFQSTETKDESIMADKEVFRARLAFVIPETSVVKEPAGNNMEGQKLEPENVPSSTFHRLRETSVRRYSPSLKSEIKPNAIPLLPELQIRQLTKLQPCTDHIIRKSPSLPSSPIPFRPDLGVRPTVPAYLTLRGAWDIKPSRKDAINPCRSNSDSEVEEMDKIRSILASLDLAKYKRGRRSSDSVREIVVYEPPTTTTTALHRSTSAQSQRAYEKSPTKKSFLDSIPPSPRAISSDLELVPVAQKFHEKQKTEVSGPFCLDLVPKNSYQLANPKLKELTERLANSAPPSPHSKTKQTVPNTASPTSTVSFWAEPLNNEYEDFNITHSTENSEITNYESTSPKSTESQHLLRSLRTFRSSTFATFPRQAKSNIVQTEPEEQSSTISSLNLDYIQRFKDIPRNDNIRTVSNGGSLETFTPDSKQGSSESIFKKKLLPLPAPPRFLPNDASKENAIDENSDQFSQEFKQSRIIRNSYSRSLTLAQQNQKVFAIEAYSTTGNNGLKSFKEFPDSSETNWRRNDLPLADGRFCHSDRSAENTFVNVAEQPNYSKLEVECQNEKIPKKKYNSDPGTDKEIYKVSSILSTFKSEPSLSPPLSKKNIEVDQTNKENYKIPNEKECLLPKSVHDARFVEHANEVALPNIGDNISTSKTCSTQSISLDSVPSKSNPNMVNGMLPQQKRYFKKRLRGPYGEMLEQEMSKPVSRSRTSYSKDLDFLKEFEGKPPLSSSERSRPFLRSTSHSFDETQTHVDVQEAVKPSSPKRKTSANLPIVSHDSDLKSLRVPSSAVSGTVSEPSLHIRSYSAGSSDIYKPSSQWKYEDEVGRILAQSQDTRTHIVGELYETEKSYVESLQIVVKKYMKPMKGPDLSVVIDSSQVDEIFYQIPEILTHHEAFLEVLKQRLTTWDTKQKIGDIFVDVFTHQSVIDTYTAFINNWKSAKEAIKTASHTKPAVAKFLDHTSREHKGKLSIDALLIMPVQRIPRYELLIKELLKHTPIDHPDHRLLLQAQKEVHDLAVNINRVEREAFEQEQNLQKLKDIENLIEGIMDLAQLDRTFLRYDFVTIPGGLGIKKDRCLFMFSDLLLITSIKKKVAAIRKTSLATGATSYGSLESNKYKLLMRLSLRNIEITKRVDERYIKKFLKEVGYLEGDVATLGKIGDMLGTLSCHHQVLDDAVKDVLSTVSRQLIDKQTTNSQLMALELAVTMENEMESLTVIFPNPEKRMTWENNFNEAKENIALASRRSLPPIFLYSLPIRKTRAGLQVTCAVPIRSGDQVDSPDIWICSSDGLVGQICILSLQKEPEVTSFYTVCNAKILCVVYVPAICSSQQLRRRSLMIGNIPQLQVEEKDKAQIEKILRSNSFQLDSESSDEEDFIDFGADNSEKELPSEFCDGIDYTKPAVWLGTEDGCIFVYSSDDRKKTKMRLQLTAAVYDIIHFENKIFAALASGEIFVYHRDQSGSWNTSSPQKVLVTSPSVPVTKMALSTGKIWCGNANSIAVLNTITLSVEHTFQVTSDPKQPITIMVACGQGVWVTMQNSPVIKLFHATSFQEILEVNTAPSVTKMLSVCDDIIRQHKSACLRISALHTCKNVLWIGTSAGVVLTLPLPHITALTSAIEIAPIITGISQGHTGHVRCITCVETTSVARTDVAGPSHAIDPSVRPRPSISYSRPSCSSEDTTLVFSIGDGYEDFGCVAIRETAGRDDSTNHLLLWRV